ncbi:MAG TPA: hypothetical protein VN088_04300 [Nocardioides sp.]|nr:hypothetical protein [Nocardioides sp.]
MTRARAVWVAVVVALYATHAAVGIHENHVMNAGYHMTLHGWWPLADQELLVCRAAAVLGVVVLAAGALPPLRPARLEAALIATALPAAALIPVFVGPLRLGFRLYGHAEPRDKELLSGVIVLDVLIALAAVAVVAIEVLGAVSRKPVQN